jgi:hypothetical protein
MIEYTDAGKRDFLVRANDLLGFVTGAEVELLNREGTVVLTGRMDDRRKVTCHVPFDVTTTRGRWGRRKEVKTSRSVSVYHIRAVATGATVPLTNSLYAWSGCTVTVFAP